MCKSYLYHAVIIGSFYYDYISKRNSLFNFVSSLITLLFLWTGTSLKKDECMHPGFMGGLCIRCGKRMDDGSGVAFSYIHKVAVLKHFTSYKLLGSLLFHSVLYTQSSGLLFFYF